MVVEAFFQGEGGVGEAVGAGEAVGGFGEDEVGLEDGEAGESVGDGVGEEAGDLALAFAGGDVFVELDVVVLDVEVGDAGAEEGPGFVDGLADFEVIGGVEGVAEGWGVDGFEDVQGTRGGIAVDAFFVFEEEGDAAVESEAGEFGHAEDDLVAMGGGVVAGGNVEAEDADARASVIVGEEEGAVDAGEVGLEGFVDFDLAYGRADGAQGDAAGVQEGVELGVVGVGEVEDVGAVDGTELDMADVVAVEDVDLLDGVSGNLVCEGAQVDHGWSLWSGLTSLVSSLMLTAGANTVSGRWLWRLGRDRIRVGSEFLVEAEPSLQRAGGSTAMYAIILPFVIYWLVFFVACYAVCDFAQDQFYDEVTPRVGLKVAAGSAILAVLATWLKPSFETMFTNDIAWTLLQGIVWFLVFMFIFQFHPPHALGLGLVTMVLVMGLASLGVDNMMRPKLTLAPVKAQPDNQPIRKSLNGGSLPATSKNEAGK